MRLHANLLLFTFFLSRVLGYVIERGDDQPPANPKNNLGIYQLPTTFKSPYATKLSASGSLWTGPSILDLPGTGFGLMIQDVVGGCGKQDIVAIYLVGKQGVLMMGIPIERLKYGRSNTKGVDTAYDHIMNLDVLAHRASWVEHDSYDPVRDRSKKEWRWAKSTLSEIKTVGQFLQMGHKIIGEIIDSGAVGLDQVNRGLRSPVSYKVIGKMILQSFLKILPEETRPLITPNDQPTQEAFMLKVEDQARLTISLGVHEVTTWPDEDGKVRRNMNSAITHNRFGWEWPGSNPDVTTQGVKRPYRRKPTGPRKSNTRPGTEDNARRSLLDVEDEDDDDEESTGELDFIMDD